MWARRSRARSRASSSSSSNGFGQVVVGAGVETGDAVAGLGARREHEDRHPVAVGAQHLAHGEAVDDRHRHVEHDDVGLRAARGVERLGAVADRGDGVALELEGARQRVAHGAIVLGDQQAVAWRGATQHVDSLPASGKRMVRIGARPGASEDPDRQLAGAADLADAPAHGVRVGELEVREALQELVDGDGQLEPGQVRAQAAVDAETERGVAVLQAVDDDLVGALEHLGVAVGGRERQQHPLGGLHRAAVEVVVLAQPSGPSSRARRPAAAPRWRSAGGRARTTQAAAVLGVLGEVPQRRADGAPRRVDAGEQQQDDRTADVLGRQLLVAELDLQQVRRQVVARVGAVVLDLHVDVGVELRGSSRPAPRARG